MRKGFLRANYAYTLKNVGVVDAAVEFVSGGQELNGDGRALLRSAVGTLEAAVDSASGFRTGIGSTELERGFCCSKRSFGEGYAIRRSRTNSTGLNFTPFIRFSNLKISHTPLAICFYKFMLKNYGFR